MIDSTLLEIVAPAFVVGLMIALTHAPLGIEVLRRGIIFMDLAIAQFAGLGLVLVHDDAHPLLLQVTALSFALGAALLFRVVERVLPQYQEAIIGSAFVCSASLTLLLLADNPHGGEAIQELLSGQMLFVTWADILYHLPVYILVFICWFALPKACTGFMFYTLFALVITSSVQLVGIYVVFASLILPALAVVHFKQNKILCAWGVGLASVTSGLFCAIWLDMPAGPVIVLAYMCIAAITLCFFELRAFVK